MRSVKLLIIALFRIKWEPRDENKAVTYGQKAAIRDYIINNSNSLTWTAFIDMDEFIYSIYPIKKIIAAYLKIGMQDIVMIQKKISDRFDNLDKPVTAIVDCIEGIDTSNWGRKHILRNSNFNLDWDQYWNIHGLPTKDGKNAISNPEILRVNHYNVNKRQLEWMKGFYASPKEFQLNSQCFELYKMASKLNLFTNKPSLFRP